MSRDIGDISSIKDADKLIVYFHKEDCFFEITSSDFLRFFPKGSKCRTCPDFFVKYTGKSATCQAKMENFSTFKAHLAEGERIFGELVAFREGQELPDKSVYVKHRHYGYLWPFQAQDEFLMYDTQQRKFIKMERKNITKTYTKKGLCNYCPCRRKLQSSTTVIKHLQVLETRFFCYLILEDEKYHDEKNQARIDLYLNAIQTDQINQPTLTRRSRFTVPSLGSTRLGPNWTGGYGDVADGLESEIEDYQAAAVGFGQNDEQEQNMVSVLSEFRESYRRRFERMNMFVDQLKSKANSTGLEQGIIDSQLQLNLVKKNEDFLVHEKDFSFMKNIILSYEDLDYLMNKYGISEDYEISKARVTLNLRLKGSGDQAMRRPSANFAYQQAVSRPQVARRSVPFDKNQSRARERLGQENGGGGGDPSKFVRQNDQSKSTQLVVARNHEEDEMATMGVGQFVAKRISRPSGYDASSIPFRVKIENCIDEQQHASSSPTAKRIRHG